MVNSSKVPQMFTNIFHVMIYKAVETTVVKLNENNHNLCVTHRLSLLRCLISLSSCLFPSVVQIACKNHQSYNKNSVTLDLENRVVII